GFILKTAFDDHRDAHIRMLFFKRAVAWPRAADQVRHTPTIAACEGTSLRSPNRRVRTTSGRNGLEFDRNFRQESLLAKRYNSPRVPQAGFLQGGRSFGPLAPSVFGGEDKKEGRQSCSRNSFRQAHRPLGADRPKTHGACRRGSRKQLRLQTS